MILVQNLQKIPYLYLFMDNFPFPMWFLLQITTCALWMLHFAGRNIPSSIIRVGILFKVLGNMPYAHSLVMWKYSVSSWTLHCGKFTGWLSVGCRKICSQRTIAFHTEGLILYTMKKHIRLVILSVFFWYNTVLCNHRHNFPWVL